MQKNIRPLDHKILVKRLIADTKTASGIIIPDNAQEKPMEGVVVAVGNGKVLSNGEIEKPGVVVGDTVLFTKYSGTEVKLNGEDHLILRPDDLLGVVE